MGTPSIGQRLSLISKAAIHYEGTIAGIDSAKNTITLSSVTCHGTEDRPAPSFVPASDQTYDFIVFRADDIGGMTVYEDNAGGGAAPFTDPAVVAATGPQPQAFVTSTGSPLRAGAQAYAPSGGQLRSEARPFVPPDLLRQFMTEQVMQQQGGQPQRQQKGYGGYGGYGGGGGGAAMRMQHNPPPLRQARGGPAGEGKKGKGKKKQGAPTSPSADGPKPWREKKSWVDAKKELAGFDFGEMQRKVEEVSKQRAAGAAQAPAS